MNRVKRVGRRTGMGMIAASFLAASLLSASVTALAAEEESEEAVRTETAQTSGEGFSMSTAYPGITALAGETVTFDLNFASLDGNAYDADLSVVFHS